MSLGRLSRLFSSTPFPSFPFFVSGHWSAPGSQVCSQPGQEGKWIICSGGSWLQDSYLENERAHLQEPDREKKKKKKKSWPTQGLPNKISWGSGTSLASHSSWSFSQKKKQTNPNNLYTNLSSVKYASWERGDGKTPTRAVASGRISSVLWAFGVFQILRSWRAAVIVSNWITWVRIPDLNVICLRLLCTSQHYVDNSLKIR